MMRGNKIAWQATLRDNGLHGDHLDVSLKAR